jgi:L,D-peptidoglycan transpeptidase YkuD (ErfK/YbiS/YcfS/YnhG family)
MQLATTCIREKNLEVASSQMLVVKASKQSKTKATLQLYRKKGTSWVKVSTPIAAVIGKKGVGKTKEGDSLTPKGTYLLGTSFGWGTKPAGVNYPFRKATKYDYWVDDPKANDYNQWIKYKGNPYQKWRSFERMTHPLYKYAVVIRYNDDPIVRGSGSAIFLHIAAKSTRYTLGCVAVSEKDLVKIIKWLDPISKPIIKIEQ